MIEPVLTWRVQKAMMTPSIMTTTARPKTFHGFFADARHFQILYLGAFLLYGIFALQWDTNLVDYAAVFVTCLGVQAFFLHIHRKSLAGLKSAAITALGICLLLKAGSVGTLMLAATIAIASKFLIRIKGKHIFNPGNFGIVIALLVSNDAWVSPGQWGSAMVLLYFFGAAALMVLLKVGRVDTSLGFIITYAALEFARTVLYLGWGPDVVFHKLVNGSFLLFAFFMITDPVTTPNAPKARIVWSVAVAVLAFAMSSWAYIHTAPIWALCIVSVCTPLFDLLWKADRFQWIRTQPLTNKC